MLSLLWFWQMQFITRRIRWGEGTNKWSLLICIGPLVKGPRSAFFISHTVNCSRLDFDLKGLAKSMLKAFTIVILLLFMKCAWAIYFCIPAAIWNRCNVLRDRYSIYWEISMVRISEPQYCIQAMIKKCAFKLLLSLFPYCVCSKLAACSVCTYASPILINVASVGININQERRHWYFFHLDIWTPFEEGKKD